MAHGPAVSAAPSSLSAEERFKLIDEHIQAEVDHDLDRVMATWGDNPRLDDEAWDEHFVGRDAIREHYEELLGAFPVLAIETERRHVTENAVVYEVLVSGTHLGQWRELPPLRRSMKVKFCVVYEFDEHGLLALERAYYDKAVVLEQLGLFRDPRTTSGKAVALAMPPFTIVRGFGRKLLRIGRRNHS